MSRRAPRWFAIGLVAVGLLALAVRVLNVLVWAPTCDADLILSVETATPYPECEDVVEYRLWGDAAYGFVQGYLLAQGHGFADTATWFQSDGADIVPSAGDPPMFALFLAVFHLLGVHDVVTHRLITAGLGTLGVLLLAGLGARLAGHRAGLAVGVLAALYPHLWINDAMLLSESLYVPMLALTLLAAYRFWDRPTLWWAATLGAAIASTALTRGEAMLLFGVLVLPLLWGLQGRSLAQRGALAVTIWMVGGILMGPWIVYNLARFEAPVFLTSQTGAVLAAGACDVAFYGESLGYYGADCYTDYVRSGYAIGHPALPGCDAEAVAALDAPDPVERARADACWPDPGRLDESQRDQVIGDLARRYLADNRQRLPVVMTARVARMLELYNPDLGSKQEPLGQNVLLNWAVEGRGRWQSRAGFIGYWLLVPASIAGVVMLQRRRTPLSPLLAMPVVIVVTAALAFGVTRYRVPLDLSMVVLAGIAIDGLLGRRWPAPDEGTVRPRPVRERRGLRRRGRVDDRAGFPRVPAPPGAALREE